MNRDLARSFHVDGFQGSTWPDCIKESGRTTGNETIGMRTPASTIEGGLIVSIRWHSEPPKGTSYSKLRHGGL